MYIKISGIVRKNALFKNEKKVKKLCFVSILKDVYVYMRMHPPTHFRDIAIVIFLSRSVGVRDSVNPNPEIYMEEQMLRHECVCARIRA